MPQVLVRQHHRDAGFILVADSWGASIFAEAESRLVVPVPKRSLAARHCFHSPAARIGALGVCSPPIHGQRNAAPPDTHTSAVLSRRSKVTVKRR